MDRFAEKSEKIDKCRVEASALYPALWSKMISEWNAPDPEDRVWLTYSANYLFRTNNVRWAIDPLTLNWRIKDSLPVNVMRDLGGLSFVLLTHDHKDHLDLDLLSALRDLPIIWIVPEFILSKVMKQAGLPREKIIIPSPLAPIELNGIRVLPFDGLHWETTSDDTLRGVPAMGYLIECNGRRWLFPGDTRNYDASRLPSLEPADILFAHLWLGRSSALMDEPPLLDAFCRFCLDLEPSRVILAHLNEFGRDANDLWDESHARCVSSRIEEINPGISVTPAYVGGHVLL
jgi:L-ascorbate metabolism protein UlaG (beta-lactamase superfamily)